MKKDVVVLGAGFSGLLVAYRMSKLGHKVFVYEKRKKSGGMISARKSAFGLSECAAITMLASKDVEDLANEIGLSLLTSKKESSKRYIYRNGKPHRWPLSLFESFRLVKIIIQFLFSKSSLAPRTNENISSWGERCLGKAITNYLLLPALGGIYAGDGSQMSASLILGKYFSKNGGLSKKGNLRGPVSTMDGLSGITKAIENACLKNGVQFYFGEDAEVLMTSENKKPDFICTNGADAVRYLKNINDPRGELLEKITMLPLISLTAYFPKEAKSIDGFGVLFPRDSKFQVLGALMNHSIFPGRTEYRSETWIYGGATNLEIIKLSDEEIKNIFLEERRRLLGELLEPLHLEINRWPEAIPHYNIQLENVLKELPKNKSPQLFGNYMGVIGLTKLVESSKELSV